MQGELPRSAIIAVAHLVDVRRTEDVGPFMSAQERDFGDYTSGRFAWMLDRSRLWIPSEPIHCSGALGLWTVPLELHARLHE